MASRQGITTFDRRTGTVVLPDRFDFHAAKEILKRIKAVPEDHLPLRLHLDCSRTRFIDSAALGSLLLLGEYLVGKCTILMDGATGTVRGLLDLARIEERLAGSIPLTASYDLRACARCGRTARDRCRGTLAEAARCPHTAAHPVPRPVPTRAGNGMAEGTPAFAAA